MQHVIKENTKQKIQCQICLEEFLPIELQELGFEKRRECNCIQLACIDCLYQWTLESVNSSISIAQKNIKCVNSECQQSFLLSDILSLFNKSQKETINDISIKRFLSNNQDCVPCQRCSLYSFKDDTNNCSDPFICPHCDYEQQTEQNESIKTILYELFFTDPCPSCGIHIQKTGGCSTMECKKCDYKFCWYCKKPGESKHNRKYCIGHQAAKWLIYCNITTNIFLILNLQTYLGHIIKVILSSIGNIFFGSFIVKFFFYNLLLVFVVMTILGIKSTVEIIIKIIKENQQGSYVEKYYKKRRKFIKKTVFTFLMSGLELLIIDFNNCFYDMLQFIFWEIIVILCFITVYVVFSLISHFIKQAKKNKKQHGSSVYTYNYTDWLSKVSKERNHK